MTYRGQVKNGVVEFPEPVPLEEGTVVDVEPVAERALRRGTIDAILGCGARWHGEPEEMDRLLAELREMKRAEVQEREARGDDEISS